MDRRLAAILAADVVGYSRMMALDENATLAAFNALRDEVIVPLVSAHQGRVVKTMGDGFLVEFQSVVASVECALSWQEACGQAQANGGTEAQLRFRIGVNLGEIVVDGDDILGDGVIVAARLESEAGPGAVCISEDVYRQVRGKIPTPFIDMGERALKNLPQPVRLFQTEVLDRSRGNTSSASFTLNLMGGFELIGPHGAIEVTSKKLRGLLAYLAVSPMRPHSRDTLMALLWGSHFDKQARQNLRQGLSRLRKQLGPDVLVIDDDAVSLRPGSMTSDVARITEALSDPSGETLRAIGDISSAELLEGLSIPEEGWTEWLDDARLRLRNKLVDAYVRLSEMELGEGNDDVALQAAERALSFDPLREDAFRSMVQALRKLGRGSSALERYASFKRRLDEELDAAPAPETLALITPLQAGAQQRPDNPDTPVAPSPEIPDEPSLAVIPFRNITRDERAEIIASGLAEDIVTTLTKISSILVVARASTQKYQDADTDWRSISREQGVRYVLAGAVNVVGDRVRVTAHLRDASTGREIWADRFDRWFEDFLDIQDEITKEVVSALQVELTDGEQARIWAGGTRDTKAWENVVVATELIHAHHRDGISKARQLAEEAVRRDPDFAAAQAAVGWTHWVEGRWGWQDSRERFSDAAVHAERALSIDPENPDALSLNAVVLLHLGLYDEAVAAIEEATRNAPGHAHIAALAGYVHRYAGAPERVIDCMERAIRLSPVHPAWYPSVLGSALWRRGNTDRAQQCFVEANKRDPEFELAHALYASMLGELGKLEEAREPLERLLSLEPAFSARVWCDQNPFKNHADREREYQGLIKAGAPN